MKYLTLGENNKITAFYDDAVHAVIPSTAIRIGDNEQRSTEIYQELIENGGQKIVTNIDTFAYEEAKGAEDIEDAAKPLFDALLSLSPEILYKLAEDYKVKNV